MYHIFHEGKFWYGSVGYEKMKPGRGLGDKWGMISLLHYRSQGKDTRLIDDKGIDVTPSEEKIRRLLEIREAISCHEGVEISGYGPGYVVWKYLAQDIAAVLSGKKHGLKVRHVFCVKGMTGKEIRELGVKGYVMSHWGKRFVLTWEEEDAVMVGLYCDVLWTLTLPEWTEGS